MKARDLIVHQMTAAGTGKLVGMGHRVRRLVDVAKNGGRAEARAATIGTRLYRYPLDGKNTQSTSPSSCEQRRGVRQSAASTPTDPAIAAAGLT
jgi:hypothetical protein